MNQETTSTQLTITDPLGLHLRVGKELVTVANRFEAVITAQNLSRRSPVVDVKSILQVMQLQARQGHVLELCASGPDAPAALAEVCRLLGVGETPQDIAPL